MLPDNIWGFLLSDKTQYLARLIKGTKPLSEYGEVNATSTASESDSYGIHFRKGIAPNSLRILNTGTIDRYISLWGIKEMKHGGNSYMTPYLQLEKVDISPYRVMMYKSPKIIFAKMATCCEAFLDLHGDYASVNTNGLYQPKHGASLKFLLGFINSKLFMFFYEQFFGALRMSGGYYQFQAPQLRVIPTKYPTDKSMLFRFEKLVDQILSAKTNDPHANTVDLEGAIDQLFYQLYGLTPEEIAVVEGIN